VTIIARDHPPSCEPVPLSAQLIVVGPTGRLKVRVRFPTGNAFSFEAIHAMLFI